MKAVYSITCRSWIVLWRGALQDIRGRRFWNEKEDLMHDLKRSRLKLIAGNRIVADDSEQSALSYEEAIWGT